jgi:signal transduction histidine kinase
VDDRVIGVFSAGWRSPVPVSDDMRLILEAAASMSAAALHRIGLVHDLKREQQRLRNVLEDLPVAASIIDIAGPRVRWRNRQARRFFGDVGTPDAVAATFGTDALGDVGRSGARNDHFRSILMEETTPGWAVIETGDGQRRILSPTIARLDAESSVVIHVDVTREVHIDQERSRFVHMVSHHLRTPLTPLLGYAHLLADATLDPATRTEAVEAVEASLVEITNLVARLELIASLQPVDPQVMSLHSAGALIDEAWTHLVGADPGDLHVSGNVEALIPCAKEHVVDALKELFANALTHGIPPVEVSITVGRTVQLSVSDAGDGIPVEWETAIFAPFVSAEQGYIAPAADHIGLGLHLARGLILATRGELAYSDGAFTIRLQPARGQLRHDLD